MAKTPYLEPSDELLVIKTDKKVFHVHPKLEENPSKNEHNKVFSEDSKVCFCINDNRYGKGDKAIRTYFNLSLAEFYSVQRAVNKGYLTEGNFLKKFVHICGKTPIHGDVCPSHHMTVSRLLVKTMVAPIRLPMSAWLELDGMENHHVARSQMIAPRSAARMT